MEDWIGENLPKAEKIAQHGVCNHCLGRMFAKCGTGMTDLERGEIIRKELENAGIKTSIPEFCPICENIFSLVPRFAQAVIEKIAETESDNFLIGCKLDPIQAKNEKEFVKEMDVEETSEPLKTELNREIGKEALPKICRKVEFKEPQVVACVDTRFAEVELDIAPIFIAGRYTKMSREIPQTTWPCRVCGGKGCHRCHGTGLMYQASVESVIGDIALEMTGGDAEFFHGMGREDIDARMLGSGRPFVLEVSHPRKREIDLDELERRANESVLANYHNLHFVPRPAVAIYKNSDPDKVYRAHVLCDGKVNKEEVVQAALSFENVHLAQRTPERVEHRRADLVRDRIVYKVEAENIEEDSFDLVLRTQSGTYVKEFVSGDDGRTSPSFSERLGIPCRVYLLDVLEIDYHED